jgi:hypothetical protein
VDELKQQIKSATEAYNKGLEVLAKATVEIQT